MLKGELSFVHVTSDFHKMDANFSWFSVAYSSDIRSQKY